MRRMFWPNLLGLVVCVLGSLSHAMDLRAPFELENAKTLPAKIRNPRFKNVFTSITGRFDGTGSELPLGNKLNKVVTWNDVLEAQPSQDEKTILQGMLNTAGVTDNNTSPGSTTGQVNTFVQVFAPVLAYGVTDDYTLAVAVPIYSVQMDQDAGFIKSSQGQAFIDQVTANNVEKADEAKNKLNNAINEKLKRLGYQTLTDQQFQSVGDVKLVGKYVLKKESDYAVTLKHEVTFPTGAVANPDNALAIPIGDGQWDAGLGIIYDQAFLNDFTWNSFAFANAQLPALMTKRLPTSATDSLSADKEQVLIDLGDVLSGGTSVSYSIPGVGITTGVGYQIQYMAKASVQNGVYAENRYRLLENELPSRTLHSLLVTAGFSTVEMYKQKKFFLPLQANLAYSQALAGINATTNSMLSAELVLFF